jgi:hypothetical protein
MTTTDHASDQSRMIGEMHAMMLGLAEITMFYERLPDMPRAHPSPFSGPTTLVLAAHITNYEPHQQERFEDAAQMVLFEAPFGTISRTETGSPYHHIVGSIHVIRAFSRNVELRVIGSGVTAPDE